MKSSSDFAEKLIEPSDDPVIKAAILEYAEAYLDIWAPGIEGKNPRFVKAFNNLKRLRNL